jgi:hypothetical protein
MSALLATLSRKALKDYVIMGSDESEIDIKEERQG